MLRDYETMLAETSRREESDSIGRGIMRAALGLSNGEQRQERPAPALASGGPRAAPQAATRAERLFGTVP